MTPELHLNLLLLLVGSLGIKKADGCLSCVCHCIVATSDKLVMLLSVVLFKLLSVDGKLTQSRS